MQTHARPATANRSNAMRHRASPRAEARAMIEALSIPCARFGAATGALLDCNKAFRDEFGVPHTRADFAARFDAFPGAGSGDGTEGAVVGIGSAEGHEEVYCAGNGRSYALHWSPVGPGKRTDLLLTAANLSERTETLSRHSAMQEQLMFTSRAMSVGEMATTLAHELNQPLAAIINYLSTAQKLGQALDAAPPRLGQALGHARAQAEHAAEVIARLREFVRPREPRLERHALRELATHVLQLLQLEAQKHRIRVSLDFPEHLPLVWVDRVMIEQVLANLIKNGIEAMRETTPAQRRLTIAANANAEGRVEVRVTDRGCGVDGGDEQQVFSPFFSTKASGMGVGLAICRSIVEYHEGSLFYERNEAGGAIFAFTLTAAADA